MKFKLSSLFFIIFILVIKTTDSQVYMVDSLEAVLSKEKNLVKQIDLLNELFTASSYFDYERALKYSKRALEKSKLLNQNSVEYKTYVSDISNNIGTCFISLSKYDSSFYYLLYSLEVAEEILDTTLMSKAINNIGVTYGYKGDLDKAFDYFSQSAELDLAIGNVKGASYSYINIASYFFGEPKGYDKGKVVYDRALAIIDDNDLLSEKAALYVGHAAGLTNIKNYTEALNAYNYALEIRIPENNLMSLFNIYLNKSHLFLLMDRKKDALMFAKKTLDIAQELNSPDDIRLSYQGLSEVYSAMGKNSLALETYVKSVAWKDSVLNIETSTAIAEMDAKYNFEKKEKENEILKQDRAIDSLKFINQQKELESSKVMTWSAIGGGVLFLLLAFTLFNRNKLKQKANDKLIKANDDLVFAKNVIEEKNRDITASIEYAKYIQQAILPKKEKIADSFSDSFFMLLPKDLVSGDFYWFQKFGKYSVLVMADCTGHGVPGGFMSMMGVEMLNQVLSNPEILDAGVALSEMDKRIKNNLNQVGSKRQQNDGMDMVLCIFNNEDNTLQYSGANRPLVRVRDGELTVFKPNKNGVGGSLGYDKIFETNHLDFKKDDCYYMYSDGYPDQFGGERNKKFMRKKLNRLILEQSSNQMENQEEEFLKSFYNWKGEEEQIDDVCLIGVRV